MLEWIDFVKKNGNELQLLKSMFKGGSFFKGALTEIMKTKNKIMHVDCHSE